MTDGVLKFGYYVVTLVFVLLFGFFIWPTPYYYTSAQMHILGDEEEKPYLIRINRMNSRVEAFFTASSNFGDWIKVPTPVERRRATAAAFRESIKKPVDSIKNTNFEVPGMSEYYRMPHWQEAAHRVARAAGYSSLDEIAALPDETISSFIYAVDRELAVEERKAEADERIRKARELLKKSQEE